MNENENENIRTDEGIQEDAITSGIKEKGKRLAISSVVIGVISLIICALCLYLSINSLILSNQGNASTGSSDAESAVAAGFGAGLGAVFMAIYMIIMAIPGGALSITSLGLGIGSLTKTTDKKTKNIGISGVVIAAVSLAACIVSLLLRYLIK